jgi:hypothetical protein
MWSCAIRPNRSAVDLVSEWATTNWSAADAVARLWSAAATFGPPVAARMPIIERTMTISIIVKPDRGLWVMVVSGDKVGTAVLEPNDCTHSKIRHNG